MPVQKARQVKVTLYKDGRIRNTHDDPKETPHLFFERGKYTPAHLPLDGEHFEWVLSEYGQTGVPVTSLYRAYAHMAPNENSNKDNRNSVKSRPLGLVKLDCGLWAAYKVDREYHIEGASERPQREFGLIENGHVWLAQYVSARHFAGELKSINDSTQEELKKAGATLARALARLVGESELGAIELRKHAQAETTSMSADTKASLYVCFPDLHLPEKWPDLPHPKHRYGGEMLTNEGPEKVRLWLQELLRWCQSYPGLVFGNKISRKYAEKVQRQIEWLKERGLENLWITGQRDSQELKQPLYVFQPPEKALKVDFKQNPVTVENFLAEKDIVDRALRVHSSWFYGPGKQYVDQKRHEKAPPFGKEDLYEVLLDCDAGDATPAFDLVNLLVSVLFLRRMLEPNLPDRDDLRASVGRDLVNDLTEGAYEPGHVRVRQVGDLFELWQNREFLYHGFWVRQTDAGSETPRKLIRLGAVAFFSKNHDGFQYRKDELYYDPDANPRRIPRLPGGEHRRRLAKWYTYNPVPKEEMKYRHVVGDMVQNGYLAGEKLRELERTFRLPPFELRRRQQLLADRIKSAKEFSLPLAAHHYVAKSLRKLFDEKGGASRTYLAGFYQAHLPCQIEERTIAFPHVGAKSYLRFWGALNPQKFPPPHLPGAGRSYGREGDERKPYEVCWNRLILDLLAALGCQGVYGNHDGYRGDPLLNKDLDPQDQSPGWISEPGLWFEHGHRWDEFNRDGCAFGAGATNLGYYWWHNLGGRSDTRLVGGKSLRKKEKQFARQEQTCYQPGAALWFLLTHFKERLPWLNQQVHFKGNKVHPFGIYLCGHTHSGDLVDIRFFLEKAGSQEMTQTGVKEKLRSATMSKDRSTAKRYAFDQKAEYERHVAQSGKVNRLPWLKRPE